MTIQDLIDIARDEDANASDLQLVIGIGGMYFNLETSNEQDRFNPNYVCMTIERRET